MDIVTFLKERDLVASEKELMLFTELTNEEKELVVNDVLRNEKKSKDDIVTETDRWIKGLSNTYEYLNYISDGRISEKKLKAKLTLTQDGIKEKTINLPIKDNQLEKEINSFKPNGISIKFPGHKTIVLGDVLEENIKQVFDINANLNKRFPVCPICLDIDNIHYHTHDEFWKKDKLEKDGKVKLESASSSDAVYLKTIDQYAECNNCETMFPGEINTSTGEFVADFTKVKKEEIATLHLSYNADIVKDLAESYILSPDNIDDFITGDLYEEVKYKFYLENDDYITEAITDAIHSVIEENFDPKKK
ncbi:MAG: hypothetical protein ACOCP8_03575 [archaeon]